jgi:hypothetical protein
MIHSFFPLRSPAAAPDNIPEVTLKLHAFLDSSTQFYGQSSPVRAMLIVMKKLLLVGCMLAFSASAFAASHHHHHHHHHPKNGTPNHRPA